MKSREFRGSYFIRVFLNESPMVNSHVCFDSTENRQRKFHVLVIEDSGNIRKFYLILFHLWSSSRLFIFMTILLASAGGLAERKHHVIFPGKNYAHPDLIVIPRIAEPNFSKNSWHYNFATEIPQILVSLHRGRWYFVNVSTKIRNADSSLVVKSEKLLYRHVDLANIPNHFYHFQLLSIVKSFFIPNPCQSKNRWYDKRLYASRRIRIDRFRIICDDWNILVLSFSHKFLIDQSGY